MGGRKIAVRSLANGVAEAETIYVGRQPEGSVAERPLMVPLFTETGAVEDYLGAHGTALAREHRALAVDELPIDAMRLSRGDAAIPTVYVD